MGEYVEILTERGKVLYSPKMARMLARRLLETRRKKAPAVANAMTRAIGGVPKLDAMVAAELQQRKGAK